jgi:hypothetical protein
MFQIDVHNATKCIKIVIKDKSNKKEIHGRKAHECVQDTNLA